MNSHRSVRLRSAVASTAMILCALTAVARAETPEERVQRVTAATVGVKAEVDVNRIRAVAIGSGFAVADGEGIVVITTSALASPAGRRAKLLQVILKGGTDKEEICAAELLVENEELAALKIEAKQLPPALLLGKTAQLDEATRIAIAGFLDDRIRVQKSALEAIRTSRNGDVFALQLDAGIKPGHAGGPVMDQDANVIGVIASKVPGTELGLAYPVEDVGRLLKQLAKQRAAKLADTDIGRSDVEVQKARDATVLVRVPSAVDGSWTHFPGTILQTNPDRAWIITAPLHADPKKLEVVLYPGEKRKRIIKAQRTGIVLGELELLEVSGKEFPAAIVANEDAVFASVADFYEFPTDAHADTSPTLARLPFQNVERDNEDRVLVANLSGLREFIPRGTAVLNRQGQAVGIAQGQQILALTSLQSQLQGLVVDLEIVQKEGPLRKDRVPLKITGKLIDPFNNVKELKLLTTDDQKLPRLVASSAQSGFKLVSQDMQSWPLKVSKEGVISADVEYPVRKITTSHLLACQVVSVRADGSEYISDLRSIMLKLPDPPVPRPSQKTFSEFNSDDWLRELRVVSQEQLRHATALSRPAPPERVPFHDQKLEEGLPGLVALHTKAKFNDGVFSADGTQFTCLVDEKHLWQFELPTWKLQLSLWLSEVPDKRIWQTDAGLAVSGKWLAKQQFLLLDPTSLSPIKRTVRFPNSKASVSCNTHQAWMLLQRPEKLAPGESAPHQPIGIVMSDLATGQPQRVWLESEIKSAASEDALINWPDQGLSAIKHFEASPDGQLLFAGFDDVLLRFRVGSTTLVLEHSQKIAHATTLEQQTYLGKVEQPAKKDALSIRRLRFNPAGTRLEVSLVQKFSPSRRLQSTTLLFDPEKLDKPTVTIPGSMGTIEFAFAPDGKRYFTQSRTAHVVVLDAGGKELRTIKLPAMASHSTTVQGSLTPIPLPDGKSVALLGADWLFSVPVE